MANNRATAKELASYAGQYDGIHAHSNRRSDTGSRLPQSERQDPTIGVENWAPQAYPRRRSGVISRFLHRG